LTSFIRLPARAAKSAVKRLVKAFGYEVVAGEEFAQWQKFYPQMLAAMRKAEEKPRMSLKTALEQLASLGLNPRTVIDVGVAYGTDGLYDVFDEARYLMVEPLEEYREVLETIRASHDAEYVLAAAGSRSGTIVLNVHPDRSSSSVLRESEGDHVDGVPREVPVVTLDEVCAERKLEGPYVLKVDVQGAELDVLNGAAHVLEDTEVIVLEVSLFGFLKSAPSVYDVFTYMKERGFCLYDILSMEYRPLDGALGQVDMAFVKEEGRFRKEPFWASREQRPELTRKRMGHLNPKGPAPDAGRRGESRGDQAPARPGPDAVDVRRFKDIHRGKRAFIIGNGPSLTIEQLDRLRGEITFASNKIYLAFGETCWRPTYYTVEDFCVAENNRERIEGLDLFRILPHDIEGILKPNDHTIYIRNNADPSWNQGTYVPMFSRDLALNGIFGGYSVVYMQMQLAFYMGAQTVYLIGMDHNFILPKEQGRHHNYDRVLISEGERNHFHPDYRKPGEVWSMPQLDKIETAFGKAREEYEAAGREIYNATPGGKLEVFERAPFDALFEPKRPVEPIRRIGVLVCTMNRPDKFRRCLDSILESVEACEGEGRVFEIVVVDQSSDDQTRRIVEQTCGRVRHIPMTRSGISRGRNLGLKELTTEVIALTDDDCIVERDWLRQIVERFEKYPECDALFGRTLAYEPPGAQVRHIVSRHPLGYAFRAEDERRRRCYALITLEDESLHESPCYPPGRLGSSNNMACRRSAFEKMGLFSEYFGVGSWGMSAEDPELTYRFLRLGAKVLYAPKVLARHDAWQEPMEAETTLSRYVGGAATLWMMYSLKGDRLAWRCYRYLLNVVWIGVKDLRRWKKTPSHRSMKRMMLRRCLKLARGTMTGALYAVLIPNRYYRRLGKPPSFM
jgi:FkbM family methyltransferase